MTETRYQRIAREQRERQAARLAKRTTPLRDVRKAEVTRRQRDRTADRIDGYDRDDLGESPDY